MLCEELLMSTREICFMENKKNIINVGLRKMELCVCNREVFSIVVLFREAFILKMRLPF